MIGAKLLDLHGPRFEIGGRPVSVASSAAIPCKRKRGKAGKGYGTFLIESDALESSSDHLSFPLKKSRNEFYLIRQGQQDAIPFNR